MNCFDNLVGVANVCGNSTSGLYLNDLPNISIENADATIDSEYYSGVQLLKRKIEFAQNACVNFVRQEASTKLSNKTMINNDSIGVYKSGLNAIGVNERGIRFKLTNYTYVSLFISSIKVNWQYSGDFDVNVYDLITGDLLDTFSATSTSGKYTFITINKEYPAHKQNIDIAFVVDSSLGQSQKTDLRNNFCSDCYSNYNNGYVTVSGVDYDGVNATTINNTNGICVSYSLQCSVEPFLCSMSNLLSWAILHKAGAEVLKEMKYSNRLNNIVLLNRDSFDELIEAYENEYMSSLKGVLSNMVYPKDVCFDCNSKLKKVVQVP